MADMFAPLVAQLKACLLYTSHEQAAVCALLAEAVQGCGTEELRQEERSRPPVHEMCIKDRPSAVLPAVQPYQPL